ncbi:MAG TPA: hypothetical protein VG798_00935 [Rhizomicrobium sp.]|nr:hypothetical protein [Rhizomicrobium sp.]
MNRVKTFFIAAFGVAALAGACQAAMQQEDQVRKALATLNRVVGHTQRLIEAKNYERLPHENGEFKEGAEALEKGLASEPATFRAKVEPLLKKAEADSQRVADAAGKHDDAALAGSHAAFAASVVQVIALFPPEVRPAGQP